MFCGILSAEMKNLYILYDQATYGPTITAVGFITEGLMFILSYNIFFINTSLISNASETRLEQIRVK